MYLSSKITNSENKSQFKLLKDFTTNRFEDLLIHNAVSFTLYDNSLTIRDTGKTFEFKGDSLKTITNKKFNVDLASLSDKNLRFDFAKEKYFDVKAPGNKST